MSDDFTLSHRGGSGSPLVCVHGFTDTWRSWELILPALERHHDVLAVTQAGHAGGPAIPGPLDDDSLADAVERAMDAAGFDTAHIVGNSLGGYVSMQLAQRGRARSVVALAPAGGWHRDGAQDRARRVHFLTVHDLAGQAAPFADQIVATDEGRRRASEYTAVNYQHIPAALLAHQIRGVAGCERLVDLLDFGTASDWPLDAARITCPVRIVWGTEDRLLPWPVAAVRYREEWLLDADWVVLDGVGHCPQLDVPAETAELILDFTGRG